VLDVADDADDLGRPLASGQSDLTADRRLSRKQLRGERFADDNPGGGGRIVAPLKANVLRINDNIATFLNNVVGVTKDAKGTIVWAADEVVYAPEIAVSGVRVDAIAENQEDLP